MADPQSSSPPLPTANLMATVAHDFVIPEPQEDIEIDHSGTDYSGDDTDSALGSSIMSGSDASSLATSVLNYRYENGRRYHAYREGEYVIPNDEKEQDRLDLSHHVFKLVLGGALFRSPLQYEPQRVLDFGTGTGIWAIEFADEFPASNVLGTDLSPIQPTWVPTNCTFRVEDAEAEWDFSQPFDFIHARAMAGSIRDWDRLFEQAFQYLRPGGWMELQDWSVWLYSDDGTLDNAPYSLQWQEKLDEASSSFGKRMNVAHEHAPRLEATGFTNVKCDIYKVPFSTWVRDRRLKEISKYQQLTMLESVEPYTLALFTRVLGWTVEECQVLIAGVKNEIKDRSIHMYGKMYFVYGQKPEV